MPGNSPILFMIINPISGSMKNRVSRYTTIFALVDGLAVIYEYAFIVQIMLLSIGYTLLLPAVMALFMDKAGKKMATVDTSLQYTVMVTGASIANVLSLRLASNFGFIWVYVASTIISLMTVIFISLMTVIFIALFCKRVLSQAVM